MISINCLPFLLFHKAKHITAVQEANPTTGGFSSNLASDSEIHRPETLGQERQHSCAATR
jgi:hypothetical protein